MVEIQEAVEAQAPAIRRKLWNREEYARMLDAGILREGDRIELIAGEIVTKEMHNGPHATGISLGQEALRAVLGSGFHLRVQLPLGFDPDSEPEPDLAVVSGSARDYRTAHPTTAVLVAEVSDTSLAFDRRQKGSLYARAGIPEYWIINVTASLLEIYRDPGIDDVSPFGYAYRTRLTFGPDDSVALLVIPDAVIAVRDLLP